MISSQNTKLLLIRAHSCLEKFYFPGYLHEPFGILALATFLKSFCNVKVIDSMAEGWNHYWEKKDNSKIIYRGLEPKRLFKIIEKFKPDVVGITWFYSLEEDCIRETVKYVRKRFPKIKIIVGGPEPSSDPKGALENNPEIDLAVFGEGELTLKELISENFQNLDKILGIAYRQGDKVIVNSPRPRIRDFNSLPILDRKFIPFANYSKQYFFNFILTRVQKLKLPFKVNLFLVFYLSKLPVCKLFYLLYNRKYDREKLLRKKMLPEADIQSTRGCPNNCAFCSLHTVWGHQWAGRSAESVLDEIDMLVKKYKVRHINFWDENFNLLKERAIAICRGIVERNYKISIDVQAGLYVPTLDEEVLQWFKKAGANEVRFSIESGNQEVLDKVIKKRINLKTVKPIIDICKKLKIRTEGAFIFGAPGQTIAAMEDNLKFAEDCGFDRVIRFVYQPFPNTELYKICEEKGYLTPDYNPKELYLTGSKSFVKTEDFNPEDVLKIARKAIKKK